MMLVYLVWASVLAVLLAVGIWSTTCDRRQRKAEREQMTSREQTHHVS
jgi:cytochrome c-type biogenesis protein CcmH/NrfF